MKNIPIVGQFQAGAALFGVFAIAVAFYSTDQLRSINARLPNLVDHDEAAAVLFTGNASLQNARPAPPPARAIARKLAISFSGGVTAPSGDGWAEF